MADFDSLVDDSATLSSPPTLPAVATITPPTTASANFDDLQDDSERYGSAGQQAIAAAEGLARGATLGLSDVAETKLGVAPAQDIRARQEQNPWTSNLSQIAGTIGLGAATGGAGLLAEALGGGALATIGAGAVEGGVLGAGNVVSDAALGDADLTAQKMLSEVGMGAALGGGLGIIAKGVESAFPEASGALSKAIKSVIGGGTETVPEAIEGGVSDAPVEAKIGVQPTSFDDIAQKVKASQMRGTNIELPQKAVLEDAISRVEMNNPVHPLQMESLGSQTARDAYNTYKEMPGPEGDALRGYESVQKKELTDRTDMAIKKLAPDIELTPDAVKGGNVASQAFTDQYQAEKASLSPIFEQLKQTPLPAADALNGMLEKMTNAVPGVAKMFDMESGELAIKPYLTSMDIDKSTYNAVKEAVNSLRENPGDFGSLAAIRRGLDQHVDVLAQGPGPAQIRALKASMMDYMQDAVQQATPDVQVRDAFRRWAINEQQREVIEKAFGASVGNTDLGLLSKVKPEEIGDKIFKNTATTRAARNILDPEKFQEILGNWLTENRAAVTDKGIFSSNKFGSFLRKNQDALNEAFTNNPQMLQRIKDLNTISRILPDAPSINPSGTAKTLMRAITESKSFEHAAANVLGFLKQKTIDKVTDQIAMENLNNRLAGRAANATVMTKLADLNEKVGNQIGKMAKDIFTNNSMRTGAIGTVVIPSLHQFYDKTQKINELSNDPAKLHQHVSNAIDPMVAAAPNVSQGVASTIIRGVNFLNSKIPRPANHFPLSDEWEPSAAQIGRFDQYYEAVDKPLDVLQQVKNGSLDSATIEALQAVHPHLLQEMQKNVMANLNKGKNLNYATKLSIAKFIGQPLDSSMMPQVIAANQAVMQPQQQQAAGPGGKGKQSTLGGLKQINLASRTGTETQDLEQPES